MQRHATRALGGPSRRRSATTARPFRRQQERHPMTAFPASAAFATTATASSTSASSSSSSTDPAATRAIPTRHSIKGPPPICKDPVELHELTQQVLETPVGSLFCQHMKPAAAGGSGCSSAVSQARDDAYALAEGSTQLLEYLLRGHSHPLPGSLYGGPSTKSKSGSSCSPEEASAALTNMIRLLERFEEEGATYMTLRHEALRFQSGSSTLADTVSSLSAVGGGEDSDDTSSDSSSSSEDNDDNDGSSFLEGDDEDEEIEIGNTTFGEMEDLFSSVVQHKHEHELEEHAALGTAATRKLTHVDSHLSSFALPGVTTAMYDTLLDAMACSTELLLRSDAKEATDRSSILYQMEPQDLYQITQDALTAHELNNQSRTSSRKEWFPYTVPTMVTYNATIRGIGNLCLAAGAMDEASKQPLLDQGLAYGFGIYNQLTNNVHALPKRNAASIIYLLKVIQACLPPSRTRGNMTVTLWHQASREGLVTPELVAAIQELHAESNGPEFEVFLEALEKCRSSTTPATGGKAGSESGRVVILPQRFARFAKKYQHSRNY